MTRSAQRRRRLRRQRRHQARRRQQTTRERPRPIIQTKRRTPKRHGCPACGKKGWRQRIKSRKVRHLAHQVPILWKLFLGVYRASCSCQKFFTATLEGVALRAGYTDAVRQKVVDLLVRDHLSVYKVQRHLREDFALEVSVGFIYDCLQWAEGRIDKVAYWAWVLASFSGGLCIDEVHDCQKAILVATDPLNDFTVAFQVVDSNDQRSMNAFLDSLKARGLNPKVAITDGSPLYKRALVERWDGLQHQLCLFHFLKDLCKDVLDAARSIRAELPVNAPHRAGRPRRRGRPRKSRRWRQDLLTENLHLLVQKRGTLTATDRQTLESLYGLDRRLSTLRRFVDRAYACFPRDITPQAARNRRTRLLRDRRFQREPLLADALKRLSNDEVFEKLLTYLSWHGVDRTSNHVERKNRAFRLVQKTRYKRRSGRRIEQAYWLHLARDRQQHPLQQDITARPSRIRRRPHDRIMPGTLDRCVSEIIRETRKPLRRAS